jgi:hypothetical protein
MATSCHTPMLPTPSLSFFFLSLSYPSRFEIHREKIEEFLILQNFLVGNRLGYKSGTRGINPITRTSKLFLQMSPYFIWSSRLGAMGAWQGVAMDSLKFHPGPPCPTLLCPAGGPSLKRPYGRFRGDPHAGQAACGRLLPSWIPALYAYGPHASVHYASRCVSF